MLVVVYLRVVNIGCALGLLLPQKSALCNRWCQAVGDLRNLHHDTDNIGCRPDAAAGPGMPERLLRELLAHSVVSLAVVAGAAGFSVLQTVVPVSEGASVGPLRGMNT